MAPNQHDAAGFTAAELAEFVGVFIDETNEQCDRLVESLLALETDAGDSQHLAVAFRMVHSIKGSAAILGLERITAVAHHLEGHFETLRSGGGRLDRDGIQLALACVDYLRDATARLRAGEPVGSGVELVEALKALAAMPAPAVKVARRVRLRFAAGLPLPDVKTTLVLKRLGAIGSVLQTVPSVAEIAAGAPLDRLDIVLETAAESAAIIRAADLDGVESVELDPVKADDDPLAAGPTDPAPAAADRAERGNATAVAPSPGTPAEGMPVETMRVGVDRLDVLLDLAGELVVNRARFAQLVADLAPSFRKPSGQGGDWQQAQRRYGELVESVDHLTRIVDSVQREVLGTRMVPIGPLFGRFRRSVRDIAHELGKDVALEVVGDQTELDKRMVDELGDPLVHLVRNAIDHGIEPAATRAARGKPAGATLRLEAAHRGNEVVITITDDGGGIDLERVRVRAVERGLVTAERAAKLSPREIIEFIWQPGFSTAKTVSNISGRGVGMDIVRTKIEGLSGTVEVDSSAGVGTTFTIRLPLTLAISRCLLFRLGETTFAIPVEHVQEIVTVASAAVLSVAGRRVCDIRGAFLPLLDVGDVFAWPAGGPAAEPRTAVLVVRAGGRLAAIGVPTLLGTRDLVVKPLDDNFRRVRGLGGASVLGDGEVCLLVDAAALIGMMERSPATEQQ